MRQLAQFLTSTGRRLRALGKVVSQFFRNGKLGLKLAIKIPFFVEIEISFESSKRPPSDALRQARPGGPPFAAHQATLSGRP
ncbi:hypothetical protein ACC761_14960 [Rhizobium ruizarguesonis]